MDKNPEKEQDRAFDTYDHFNRFGYILFPQQSKMYNNLAAICAGWDVLESGCGAGIGSAIIERVANSYIATDVSPRNIRFASELYPWIDFRTHNIQEPFKLNVHIAIAIEVVEHVADTFLAIQNLLDAATLEVWFSSPNGRGKPRPPDNSYHVCEYTPNEIQEKFPTVQIFHWENMQPLSFDTNVDPLLYRIRK